MTIAMTMNRFAFRYKFNLGDLSTYRTELMGISTLGIIACHTGLAGVILPTLIKRIFVWGDLGVDIFLLLSGLGLYYSLDKFGGGDLKVWYIRRFKRILVPYTIITVPYFTLYCIREGKSLTKFLLYYSTLSFWTERFGEWFIALLIPLYVLTPFLLVIVAEAPYPRYIFTVFLIVLSLTSASFFMETTKNALLYNIGTSVRRLPCFFVGLAIGPSVKCKRKTSPLVMFASAVLFVLFKRFPFYRDWLMVPILIPIACLLCRKLRWFAKCMQKIGVISLESYLLNDALRYILGMVSWHYGDVDLSYGNYLMYTCVAVFGLLIGWGVHLLSRGVIDRKIKIRKT